MDVLELEKLDTWRVRTAWHGMTWHGCGNDNEKGKKPRAWVPSVNKA